MKTAIISSKLLILLYFTVLPSYAQDTLQPKVRELANIDVSVKEIHLYLMVGQSNMAGNVAVEASDTVPNRRILRLNKKNEWEIAKEPLRIDKPILGLSPGLTFAKELIRHDTTLTIGLIPSAVGGTSIDCWKPGAYDPKTNLYPYDQAIERAKIAMKSGTLKGIIWHQGEGDSNPEKSQGYMNKLKKVIEQFRSDLGNPSLPFVAGLLPDFQKNKKIDGKVIKNHSVEVINSAILKLQKEIDNYEVISLKGASHKGDGTHLDVPSVRIMGKKYAKAMEKIVQSR